MSAIQPFNQSMTSAAARKFDKNILILNKVNKLQFWYNIKKKKSTDWNCIESYFQSLYSSTQFEKEKKMYFFKTIHLPKRTCEHSNQIEDEISEEEEEEATAHPKSNKALEWGVDEGFIDLGYPGSVVHL